MDTENVSFTMWLKNLAKECMHHKVTSLDKSLASIAFSISVFSAFIPLLYDFIGNWCLILTPLGAIYFLRAIYFLGKSIEESKTEA